MLSPDSTPRKRGEAWVQREGDRTAVYNPDSGMLHLLNPPALAIWELCDGETKPAEMAAAISEVTGIESDVSAADVDNALSSLLAAGLIEMD
jgi:PqqD family protein of HPr-rel-A system